MKACLFAFIYILTVRTTLNHMDSIVQSFPPGVTVQGVTIECATSKYCICVHIYTDQQLGHFQHCAVSATVQTSVSVLILCRS